MAPIRYEAIRPKLDTGDIVLFSGAGVVSRAIKIASMSHWSHVGMVIRTDHDIVLCFESTSLYGTSGVQLNALSDRIARYRGEVAIRRLQCVRDERFRSIVEQYRREMAGRPYERHLWQLWRAAWDVWGDSEKDLSSLFCSELAAEQYIRLELLPDKPASSEYTPRDFAGYLRLNNATLYPPVSVIA